MWLQICSPMGPLCNLTPAPTEKDKTICPLHTPIPPRGSAHSGAIWSGFADSVWCDSFRQQHTSCWASPALSGETAGRQQQLNGRMSQLLGWSRRGNSTSVDPFKLKWVNSRLSFKVDDSENTSLIYLHNEVRIKKTRLGANPPEDFTQTEHHTLLFRS